MFHCRSRSRESRWTLSQSSGGRHHHFLLCCWATSYLLVPLDLQLWGRQEVVWVHEEHDGHDLSEETWHTGAHSVFRWQHKFHNWWRIWQSVSKRIPWTFGLYLLCKKGPELALCSQWLTTVTGTNDWNICCYAIFWKRNHSHHAQSCGRCCSWLPLSFAYKQECWGSGWLLAISLQRVKDYAVAPFLQRSAYMMQCCLLGTHHRLHRLSRSHAQQTYMQYIYRVGPPPIITWTYHQPWHHCLLLHLSWSKQLWIITQQSAVSSVLPLWQRSNRPAVQHKSQVPRIYPLICLLASLPYYQGHCIPQLAFYKHFTQYSSRWAFLRSHAECILCHHLFWQDLTSVFVSLLLVFGVLALFPCLFLPLLHPKLIPFQYNKVAFYHPETVAKPLKTALRL